MSQKIIETYYNNTKKMCVEIYEHETGAFQFDVMEERPHPVLDETYWHIAWSNGSFFDTLEKARELALSKLIDEDTNS